MAFFPVFLSVVIVTRNQADYIEEIISEATLNIAQLVSDYELIIIDNASEDESILMLKNLTGEDGYANLQVYALTKEVDADTAFWVGLEHALGDFVVALDPMVDDIQYLSSLLEPVVNGADVVFASNNIRSPQTLYYRVADVMFNWLYKKINNFHLSSEAPQYRVMSRALVNFILRHPHPEITYRHLPAAGGFSRVNLRYSSNPKTTRAKRLGDSVDRGIKLLVSTTRAPMRLVTILSLFGAASNLLYSVYVIVVGLFKVGVAPGWVSLSLQQSGMFLLISLVLLVLGEYILHMASLSNEGPRYHVGQEFLSVKMTRNEKLNLEESKVWPHGEGK